MRCTLCVVLFVVVVIVVVVLLPFYPGKSMRKSHVISLCIQGNQGCSHHGYMGSVCFMFASLT